MAEKAKAYPLGENPALAASEVFARFSTAMTEAADRSLSALGVGFDAWAKEGQVLFDTLSTQGLTRLDQLKACKSPLDVLTVEQAWFAARSKAYLDSGLRITRTFAHVAESLAAQAKAGGPSASI